MTKRVENRGGPRPNSGPKKKIRNHSDKTIRRYEAAAKRLAKETGETLEYALLKMVYSPDVQDSVKASIMKQYNEAMIIKTTESSVKVEKTTGPAIGLPVARQDPALELVRGGKK